MKIEKFIVKQNFGHLNPSVEQKKNNSVYSKTLIFHKDLRYCVKKSSTIVYVSIMQYDFEIFRHCSWLYVKSDRENH